MKKSLGKVKPWSLPSIAREEEIEDSKCGLIFLTGGKEGHRAS